MTHTIWLTIYRSPAGELVLGDFEGRLCLCDWRYRTQRARIDTRLKTALDADFSEGTTPLLQAAATQLDEYFAGRRQVFDLPLEQPGTPFQKAVWKALMAIPPGRTASYLELARTLGNEDAVRAVASANGANALAIVVPCHRVIGSNGDLVGYAGGLAAKKKLLALEHVGASQPDLPLQAD